MRPEILAAVQIGHGLARTRFGTPAHHFAEILHVVTGNGRRTERRDGRDTGGIGRFQLVAEHFGLNIQCAQIAVPRHVGRERFAARENDVFHLVEVADQLDRQRLGNRQVHFELQHGHPNRILRLRNGRKQIAQLHLRRQVVVLRGHALFELHLRIVHRALDRRTRLFERRQRLFGQQDIVEGLFHLGHQRNTRRPRRLDGRCDLRAVQLQRPIDCRREERHREAGRTGKGIVGAERDTAAHRRLFDRAGVLPARRQRRQQIAARLLLHVIVALHVEIGHLDRGVLAEGHLDRVVQRQPELRRGASRCKRTESQC